MRCYAQKTSDRIDSSPLHLVRVMQPFHTLATNHWLQPRHIVTEKPDKN